MSPAGPLTMLGPHKVLHRAADQAPTENLDPPPTSYPISLLLIPVTTAGDTHVALHASPPPHTPIESSMTPIA